MRTSARRRDRGVQAARGFAGTRLDGAERSDSGGSWVEVPCGAPRGGVP